MGARVCNTANQHSPTTHPPFIHSTNVPICTFAVPPYVPYVVFEDGPLPLHQRVFPTVRKGRLKPFKQKWTTRKEDGGNCISHMVIWIHGLTLTLIRNNTNHLLKCDTQFTIHTRCTHTLHTTHYRIQDAGRRIQVAVCRIHTLLSCVSFLTSLRPNPNPIPLTLTCPFSPHFDLRRVFEAPLRTGR